MPIAIGDIHGCLEPLRRLVERLPPDEELVFLGDYIDRGPHSAGVVQYLLALAKRRPCRFLMGNHEQLMMAAVVEPESIPHWLMNGGAPTLVSYGTAPRAWSLAGDRRAFLGQHHGFYKTLAFYWEDEDTIYVHAGIDVRVADMRLQEPEILLWIREQSYLQAKAWSGKQVVFGHTPTRSMGLGGKTVFHEERFFGIDTGCVYGGYLTAWHSRTHELWQERSDFPPARDPSR
jgi:serine/threonine protein phosphatase 1